MATLKTISTRLKSIKSIQKITKSMKMVSAAKYARADRELRRTRPLGEGSKAFYQKAEVLPVESAQQRLIVAMTSDKGLCGGVHTSIVKKIRAELSAPDSDNIKLVCVGEKSTAMLRRLYSKNILLHAHNVGKLPPIFLDASKIANHILKSDYEMSRGKIVYNKYKSAVSFVTQEMPIYSLAAIHAAPKIDVYDELDNDLVQDYLEFSFAALVYYTMKESACSELSSKMNAMENASKNAGEMIQKLTLRFNRTRQAVITRELIEIISGASAQEKER